jgi:hypothetical protein
MPKGHTNNPAGKPKGIKNRRTLEWQELGESIRTKHAERFNNVLDQLDDEKFAEMFLRTMEYFEPKLQRSEVKQDTGPVEIRIVRDYGTGNSAKASSSEPTEDN